MNEMVEDVEQTAGLKDANVVLQVCAVHLRLWGCGLADSLEWNS